MNVRQKIIDYYKYADQADTVQSFSLLKTYMLYPITIMDDNLLNLVSGIATGLSINIFTGFMSFEGRGTIDLLMWSVRLISAIIVNYCIIRLAIICTILRVEAREKGEEKRIQRDKTIEYRKSILKYYDENYSQIRKYTIRGIIWLVVLLLCVIVIPVVTFVWINRLLCEVVSFVNKIASAYRQ